MFSFSRNITFSLSLVMVLGILFAGLYPFNYSPSNQVTRLDDKDGILFYGSGEAVSIEDTIWPHAGYSGQPITMELHLRPLRAYHEGVPHILSLCDRAGREVFYLGQWKNYMVMRLLGDKRFLTRIDREAGTPDFPESGQPVFLTIVFHEDRLELYADAKLAGVYDNFDLIGAIDRRPVRSMVFGNSSVGEHPWQGEIFRFSVFDGALDPSAILDRYRRSAEGENNIPMGEVIHYRFDSPQSKTVPNSAGQKWDLLIPETLTPLRREFLSLPEVDNFRKRWFYTDALLNLAGFVPLGLALAMLVSGSQSPRRMRTITLPVTAGFFLSLFIEVSQGFMVTRSSSLTDLFLNTVGTLAGALAFLALSRAPFSKLSR